jgi:hypothetical protein
MTITTALALLAAGIGGGLASTIASVVSYPILLSLGLPPLSANVTNTVSLVLTGLGSVLGSRPELTGQRARVIRLGLVTACGGGTGAAILLLAALSTMLAQSLVWINAVKNAIAGSANGVAAILFAEFAPVHWSYVPLLAAGFLIGGYVGPRVIRRLPVRALRLFIAAVGFVLAVKLALSAYR